MIELGAFHLFAPRRETGGPPFDENRRLTFAFEGGDAVLVDYQDYELGRGKEARDDSFAGLTGCPRCPSKRMDQASGSIRIITATDADLDAVLRIEREAFGQYDEANLVAALLRDPTAQPRLSLLAYDDDQPIGHVLFTRVTLDGRPDVSCSILAPLAVVPVFQRRGVGRALIEHGARLLAESGVKWLFVLGAPVYHTRCGFAPAFPYGLRAPYPIVPEEAWMVRSLVPDLLGAVEGTVACASSLGRPEYWRE